jgi:hypothetical protein
MSAPRASRGARAPLARGVRAALLPLALAIAVASCEDGPTGTERPERSSLSRSRDGHATRGSGWASAGADAAALTLGGDTAVAGAPGVSPLGTLPLPVNQNFSGGAAALRIVQNGAGPTGAFVINNAASASTALLGNSSGIGAAVKGLMTGNGRAGLFELTNAGSTNDALRVTTTGLGRAIYGETIGRGGPVAEFVLSHGASGDPAVRASTIGSGSSVEATTTGSGNAVLAINYGTGSAGLFDIRNPNNGSPALAVNTDGGGAALSATSTGAAEAGRFQLQNANSTAYALYVETSSSRGSAGRFHTSSSSSNTQTLIATNVGHGGAIVATSFNGNGLEASTSGAGSTAVYAETWGDGWAGTFQGRAATSKGVIITTQGGAGLQVVGGSKNAVVGTSSGARALYTEESTEVWFTDYGFGRLTNGRAYVPIDRTFAETVSLDEPYHVFVQPYGDAELYVVRRAASGFEVVRRGGDRSVEFSYRVVARRRGFEGARLERAPWADGDPGLAARP